MKVVRIALACMAAVSIGWAIGGFAVIAYASRRFSPLPLDDDDWDDTFNGIVDRYDW